MVNLLIIRMYNDCKIPLYILYTKEIQVVYTRYTVCIQLVDKGYTSTL